MAYKTRIQTEQERIILNFLMERNLANGGFEVDPHKVIGVNMESFIHMATGVTHYKGRIDFESHHIDINLTEWEYEELVNAVNSVNKIALRSPAQIIEDGIREDIDWCTRYLSDRYAQIKKLVTGNFVKNIFPIRYDPIPGRSTSYKVKIVILISSSPTLEDEILFLITQEDFDAIADRLTRDPEEKKSHSRSLGAIMPIPPKNPPPRHAARITCKVEFKDLPRTNFLLTRNHPPLTTGRAHFFRCKCDDGYFCERIPAMLQRGEDSDNWYNKVIKVDGETVHFVIPILNQVLYTFPVWMKSVEDWSGTKKKKIIAYGVSEEETFIYDAPSRKDTNCTLLGDMYKMVSELAVRYTPRWEPALQAVAKGNPTLTGICKGKNHNSVTNIQLNKSLIDSPSHATAVNSLTLELYELCYMCYRNATPAFSLLPDDLF